MSDSDLLTVSSMMDAKVKPVKAEIQRLRLEMENDHRPRLDAVEAAYMGTFKLYGSEVEKLQQMQLSIDVIQTLFTDQRADITNIKNTLTEHDKRLDRIENTLTEHDKRLDRIENTLKEHDKRFDRIEGTLQVITDQMQNLTCMVGRLS